MCINKSVCCQPSRCNRNPAVFYDLVVPILLNHLRREEEYVLCGQEMPGKEGDEDISRGGWITSRTTCRRENCQGRKRKTE